MFNDERRKNASFVFEKMKRYYPNFETPDEFAIGEWVGILDGYSQTEILEGFKNYRKNVPYNVAPTPATFKSFLQAHKAEKMSESREGEFKAVSPSIQLMQDDIKNGNCKHLLPVYELAVKYVMTDKLIEIIGASEYAKMSYGQKYKTALNNGLFDDFSSTLKKVCFNNYGKEVQFQSENELKNASYYYGTEDFAGNLAAHWRLD